MEKMLKVLIADDNIHFYELCSELFEKNGIQTVMVAKDGHEVLKAINRERPDVVLCDIFLAHLDAIAVIKQTISEMGNNVPKFMVMSSFDSQHLQNEVMSAGAAYYFLKPFDTEVLIERVIQIAGYRSEKSLASKEIPERAPDLELMVTEIIHQIGVPAHIKGYHYLRESIILAVKDADIINSVTKQLYPTVAKNHGTSPSIKPI